MSKQYTIKIYDKAGTTFKGTLNQSADYTFQEIINGGLGEFTMTLPKKFDDTVIVSQLDQLQLWVQDNNSGTAGIKVYSGYIYKIIRTLGESEQAIQISAIGYGSRFGFTPDMDSTTNISVVRGSQHIDVMAKAIIDNFKTTIGDSIVNYSATSVEASATNISYTSNCKSVLETLEKVRQMSGSTWFWKVDADNIFYFKQLPTTPTHTLKIGKDLTALQIEENSDDIKNYYVLTNGLQATDTNNLAKGYYSATSVASYWKRFEKQVDGRVTDATYMDLLGDAFVTANQNENKLITFSIRDNNYGQGYDIETVHVGDTVRILNSKNVDLYSGNLVITGLTYTPQKLDVIVADARSITSRSLTDLRTSLDQTIYEDVTPTITLVNTD